MLFKGRVLILKNAFPNAVVDEESRKLFIRVAGRWVLKRGILCSKSLINL